MDLGLNGQTAVVVGGARGIGRAIADAFASEEAHVAVLDMAPETPDIANVGIVANVIDERAMRQAAEAILARFNRIDHVIFAVGVGSGKFGFPFWNLEPSDWSRVLEINLIGAVNVAHAFVPALIEARSGTMLFLSSVAGQIGSQTDPPYSAAKAGLINFGQCVAKDLAPYGVRANILCPGMVKTALNESVWEAWNRLQPEESKQTYEEWAGAKVRSVVPLRRWQTPEDVAAMVVFLASERAANVTGQTINVDGGFVMHW